MLFGVQERRGFIVLTGEIGSGKTTVCRQFLSQLGQEVKTAVILNPNLSSLDLMAAIVKDFGIKPSGINKKDYFDDLNTTLLEWAHRGQNACLVIDESQCLSTRVLEEIRLLTNLETAKQKLLQIVLIGQPELRDIIRRPELTQLRQRIGVSFHLSGLNPQETKDYVYHRLQCVQEKKMELHFTESVLESIYLTTRGIPRLINSLCDRILMSAYAKGTQQIDWEIAQPAVEEIAFICA
jgi:general secretion pathway protein A